MKTETAKPIRTMYQVGVWGTLICTIEVVDETKASYYIRKVRYTIGSGPDGYYTETVRKASIGKLFDTFEEAKAFVIERQKVRIADAEQELAKQKEKLVRAEAQTVEDSKTY